MRRRRDNERATASGCRFMRHSGAVVFDWRRLRLFFYWRAFCEARFIVSLFFPDTLQTWQANNMNEAKG